MPLLWKSNHIRNNEVSSVRVSLLPTVEQSFYHRQQELKEDPNGTNTTSICPSSQTTKSYGTVPLSSSSSSSSTTCDELHEVPWNNSIRPTIIIDPSHPTNNSPPDPAPSSEDTNSSYIDRRSSSSSTELDVYDVHKFWLDSNLQLGITELCCNDGFAGRIESINPNQQSFYVIECNLPNEKRYGLTNIPKYITKLPSYNENECRIIFHKIASCIQILHHSNVVHRNLNFHSILISKSGKVRLRGFRYATSCVVGANDKRTVMRGDNTNNTQNQHYCGFRYNSYVFRAPETDIVPSTRDQTAQSNFESSALDIWSLGCILYMILTGVPPFRGSGKELHRNKHSGDIEFDIIQPHSSVQQLIRDMLNVDPTKRPSIDDVLQSDWMVQPTQNHPHPSTASVDLSLTQTLFRDWAFVPIHGSRASKNDSSSPSTSPSGSKQFIASRMVL